MRSCHFSCLCLCLLCVCVCVWIIYTIFPVHVNKQKTKSVQKYFLCVYFVYNKNSDYLLVLPCRIALVCCNDERQWEKIANPDKRVHFNIQLLLNSILLHLYLFSYGTIYISSRYFVLHHSFFLFLFSSFLRFMIVVSSLVPDSQAAEPGFYTAQSGWTSRHANACFSLISIQKSFCTTQSG